MEGPLDYITLRRAGELCGISGDTLRNQARRGRLQTLKLGRDNVTTRKWLHAYLQSRDTRGHAAPLPEGYVAPE